MSDRSEKRFGESNPYMMGGGRGPRILLPTFGKKAERPWELRSNIFMFPPTDPEQVSKIVTPEGTMAFDRELTPQESARPRRYLEVRAVPWFDLIPDQPERTRVQAMRVLWELVGDAWGGHVATTPRLENWRENRAATFITDIEHFWSSYWPSTNLDVDMFREIVPDFWPSGIPL